MFGWRRFRFITSSRIVILLLFLMLTWVYAFMNYAMYPSWPGDSETLKQKILLDSENYFKALAAEGIHRVDGGKHYETAYNLKRTLAVLLENIMERLDIVEKRFDVNYSNSKILLQKESTGSGKVVPYNNDYDQPFSAKDLIMRPEAKCAYGKYDMRGFPDCEKKITWMREMWASDPCYSKYGVDGSECSFIIYLSEVEKWCPKLKWRPAVSTNLFNKPVRPKAQIRTDKNELMEILNKADGSTLNLEWVRQRIERMWDSMWIPAVHELQSKQNLTNREQRKVLVYMGLLTKETGFKIAEGASSGGPLGELVQWSDVIASLYILGHELDVSISVSTLKSFLKRKGVTSQSCPIGGDRPFDLVYIDIVGLKQFKKIAGPLWTQFNCMLRVIDSFGTEPAYNIRRYFQRTGRKTVWGGLQLLPKQFFTMFPHTPDNSFMGFVVDHDVVELRTTKKQQNKALVYGKMAYMWQESEAKTFLDVINERFEIHATVHINLNKSDEVKSIPSYVKNHGILSGRDYHLLLKETMLFIGLGFPFEGPAPLEAIANGCVYLNPLFNPPRSKANTEFFKNKPTDRELTSQHPYAEKHIGKPHVWTIDMDNYTALREAVEEISRAEPPPAHLPFEYQCGGMLQRLNAYIVNQDFCSRPTSWPPKSAMHIRTAKVNHSCKETCLQDDLICEPTWFHHLNYKDVLEKAFDMKCVSTVNMKDEIYFPAIDPDRVSCTLQQTPLLYSCVGTHPHFKRICPCRSYIKGQVALCKECIL